MNVVKRKVHYRMGTKDKNCSNCANWVPEWQVRRIGGADHKKAPRCAVIGFQNSIHYQVHRDYVCDKHTYRTPDNVVLAALICDHGDDPPCALCIARIYQIRKMIIENECRNCGLKKSVDEALNSGDGVYRP